MDIKEAKEKIKFSTYSCLPFGSVMTDKEALETVLSELEKKEAVINEMAKWMAGGNKYIYATVEDVKEQFYNEVEREGK